MAYKLTSGSHLGAVRNWIKQNATNGEQVDWGSSECLNLQQDLTVSRLEHLAQDVRNAVMSDLRRAMGVCSNFEPDVLSDGNEGWIYCIHCNNHRKLHEDFRGDAGFALCNDH